jgi:hypothetical protein
MGGEIQLKMDGCPEVFIKGNWGYLSTPLGGTQWLLVKARACPEKAHVL